MEINEQDLARKLTSFYDSLQLIWTRFARAGKLTKAEEELFWASCGRWIDLMESLNISLPDNINAKLLRGDGEWESGVDEIWKAQL